MSFERSPAVLLEAVAAGWLPKSVDILVLAPALTEKKERSVVCRESKELGEGYL